MRIVSAFLLFPFLVSAQDATAQKGRALFRSNCAFCHGLTAEGGRGPNLVSAPLHHGGADDDIKRVIQSGVPGTTMPAFDEFAADELGSLVAYLRQLSGSAPPRRGNIGNPEQGKAIYAKNSCAACHRIGAEGSIYGPDLSRIGASRSLEYLRESIVHPSADILPDFESVTAVLKDGKRKTGVRLNEDTFTVQIRTPSQGFAAYAKKDLREVIYGRESLMPAYARLAEQDLNNLLAYLSTLTGAVSGTGVKEAEGVR